MSQSDGQDTEDDEQDQDQGLEARPVYPSHGPDKEGMVNEYLPAEEDWVAKTVLDPSDPHAIAALRQFDEMFPEVEGMQDMIDEFLVDFLKGRTSIKGSARSEYNRIFEAMWGGHPDEETKRWATLLGADQDGD